MDLGIAGRRAAVAAATAGLGRAAAAALVAEGATVTICGSDVDRAKAAADELGTGWACLALSNTARAGTTGFLKTLAREVAADGITVNSVQPGLHATARVISVYGDDPPLADIPAGRVGAPDDFGAVVAFLCSAQANYLTGAAIPVDGGAYQALL